MEKNYKEIFKIEPSTTNSNFYDVYRINLPNSKRIAFVYVILGDSYSIETLESLAVDELHYLEEQFEEIAGIKKKDTKIYMAL